MGPHRPLSNRPEERIKHELKHFRNGSPHRLSSWRPQLPSLARRRGGGHQRGVVAGGLRWSCWRCCVVTDPPRTRYRVGLDFRFPLGVAGRRRDDGRRRHDCLGPVCRTGRVGHRRLPGRSTAHQVGRGAHRRGLFSRHGAWFSRLGRGNARYRGALELRCRHDRRRRRERGRVGSRRRRNGDGSGCGRSRVGERQACRCLLRFGLLRRLPVPADGHGHGSGGIGASRARCRQIRQRHLRSKWAGSLRAACRRMLFPRRTPNTSANWSRSARA